MLEQLQALYNVLLFVSDVQSTLKTEDSSAGSGRTVHQRLGSSRNVVHKQNEQEEKQQDSRKIVTQVSPPALIVSKESVVASKKPQTDLRSVLNRYGTNEDVMASTRTGLNKPQESRKVVATSNSDLNLAVVASVPKVPVEPAAKKTVLSTLDSARQPDSPVKPRRKIKIQRNFFTNLTSTKHSE